MALGKAGSLSLALIFTFCAIKVKLIACQSCSLDDPSYKYCHKVEASKDIKRTNEKNVYSIYQCRDKCDRVYCIAFFYQVLPDTNVKDCILFHGDPAHVKLSPNNNDCNARTWYYGWVREGRKRIWDRDCNDAKVNGGYGAWSDYGNCSKSCGSGIKTRRRQCNNPTPKNGGDDCSKLGPANESVACNPEVCPTVHGGYGPWADYDTCSADCGGGRKIRQRHCNNPRPQHGGNNCFKLGPATEVVTCNSDACTESSLHWISGQGTGGSEELISKVDNATECISKCYKRTLNGVYANAINLDAQSNTTCYCIYGQTGRKGNSDWMNAFMRFAAPLKWQLGDGRGGSEEYAGKVSNGNECVTRCYNRTKDGKYANGVTVDVVPVRKCYCEYGQTGKNDSSMWMNTFIRSGYQWAWTASDGIGGTEDYISTVSNASECAVKCSQRLKDGAYANGATVNAEPFTRCYCEFEQTRKDESVAWTNSLMRSVDLHEAIICEGHGKDISCDNGLMLAIKNATYGRLNDFTCLETEYDTQSVCRAATSLQAVKQECEGKSACSLLANNNFFNPNPCYGTSKYLIVEYRCI